MPSVNVSFLGVCTIFQNLPSLVPPGTSVPPHRVVLVKTTLFMEELSRIAPHIAKIQFVADDVKFDGPFLPPVDPPDKNIFSLDGVTLSIANPLLGGPPFAPALECLPSLQRRLNPAAELGPPARLVYEHEPALAAAWFDISDGLSWKAYKLTPEPPCPIVPSISILHVETDGHPRLLAKPWNGGEPTTITLTREGAPPDINVINFAYGRGVIEDNRDFLLNYLTAATFPTSSVVIPEVNNCTTPSPGAYRFPRCGDAGPGCSNTQFP